MVDIPKKHRYILGPTGKRNSVEINPQNSKITRACPQKERTIFYSTYDKTAPNYIALVAVFTVNMKEIPARDWLRESPRHLLAAFVAAVRGRTNQPTYQAVRQQLLYAKRLDNYALKTETYATQLHCYATKGKPSRASLNNPKFAISYKNFPFLNASNERQWAGRS